MEQNTQEQEFRFSELREPKATSCVKSFNEIHRQREKNIKYIERLRKVDINEVRRELYE